jgi:hypothetical protein
MENKALEEKRAYFREYYKNNKEKIRLYQKRHWEKKAQEAKAKTNNNKVKEENELRIRSQEFTGDLQPRSYKLYENVREALKDFTEKHKEYKAQDIVNKAIMEFITRYK